MLYDPAQHREHSFQFGQDPGVICKAFGAVSLWLLGYADAARRQSQQAIEMSEGLSANSQAVALHFAAMVNQLCGDAERTAHFAQAAIDLSTEQGFSFWLAGAHVFKGWAVAVSGNLDAGLAELRQGIADWAATGSVTYRTYYLGLQAQVLALQGARKDAAPLLDEALALVDATEERFYEPELRRLRGEIARQAVGSSGADPATADYARALSIARQQETKSLELSAALSLAVEADAPAREASLQQLAQTYRWFTQGLDTALLQKCRTILERNEQNSAATAGKR